VLEYFRGVYKAYNNQLLYSMKRVDGGLYYCQTYEFPIVLYHYIIILVRYSVL